MNTPGQNLAVLFAYVSGSKPLLEKLGQAETLYAIDRCTRRIARIVISLRGRVVKSEGEVVMALFSAADDAYQAAIEMQQRIADLLPISGVSLSVRVGFHFGAIEIEETSEIAGDTVSTASRLVDMAADKQILISEQALNSFSAIQRNNLCKTQERTFPGELEGFRIFELLWHELPAPTNTLSILGTKKAPYPLPSSAAATKASAAAPVTAATAISNPDETSSDSNVIVSGAANETVDSSNTAATVGDQLPATCAVFRHSNMVHAFNERKGFLTIGRDNSNDIVITDRKASRNHARVEKRRDQYVLVDTSTNGTFVIFNGQPETLVRQEEIVLKADGELCFGSTPESKDSEHIIFELPQQAE